MTYWLFHNPEVSTVYIHTNNWQVEEMLQDSGWEIWDNRRISKEGKYDKE